MVKIRKKELSPEMERLAAPSNDWSGRSSVGMEEKIGEYYFLPLKNLKPYSNQARKTFSDVELNQLASTIKEHGIRQPLTVMRSLNNQDMFEIISGERRFRAAQLIGLEVAPCIIIKTIDIADEIALIENIQREDLHPIELGEAYIKILETKKHGGISKLAQKLGKSISSVSEYSKFATLPQEIKSYLIEKNIRSKILYRKLCVAKDKVEMENILGINKSDTNVFIKNILRVNMDGDVFKIESKSIKLLNEEQKILLKQELNTLINSI